MEVSMGEKDKQVKNKLLKIKRVTIDAEFGKHQQVPRKIYKREGVKWILVD